MGTVVEFKREVKLPKDLVDRLDGIATECVSVMLEALYRMVDDPTDDAKLEEVQTLVMDTYLKSVEKVVGKLDELL